MHYMYAAIARVRSAFSSTDDRGATAVEYGLMVALIAAAIAGIVYLLGQNLNNKFSNVNNCIASSPPTCSSSAG
ncbi:MAG TPA: Flp family type IVb pilin [Mycobacteriales bacterium]|nr:Flp family type IVb pilin [Mycobacteriales bacterium]